MSATAAIDILDNDILNLCIIVDATVIVARCGTKRLSNSLFYGIIFWAFLFILPLLKG